MKAECRVEGCPKESHGRGLCQMHWARWRKHGDPLVVRRPGVDYMVKGRCSVPDCRQPLHAHSYCSKHLARFLKSGDPSIVGKHTGRPLKGDYPTFAAIHKRLSRGRGPARNHACIDCGGRAAEWSYNQSDPAEVWGKARNSVVPYSLEIQNYEPRCVKCHRVFDKAGTGRSRNAAGQWAPGAVRKAE